MKAFVSSCRMQCVVCSLRRDNVIMNICFKKKKEVPSSPAFLPVLVFISYIPVLNYGYYILKYFIMTPEVPHNVFFDSEPFLMLNMTPALISFSLWVSKTLLICAHSHIRISPSNILLALYI